VRVSQHLAARHRGRSLVRLGRRSPMPTVKVSLATTQLATQRRRRKTMEERIRSRLFALAVVLMLATVQPPTTAASNFGSNTASGGTPKHACDTTTSSQCIANNGTHVFCFSAVGSSIVADTRTIITNAYDSLSSISTSEQSCSCDPSVCGVDLQVFDSDYNTSFWAWTACASGAHFEGTDPRRWCKPQNLKWDTGTSSNWNTTAGRKYIACHEVGHSLGLRHSTGSSSCMVPNTITTHVLTSHDQSMLNNWYGSLLLSTEP
jgi:hypothetical protein